MTPQSPCWDCPRHLAGKGKNSVKCRKCEKRLAAVDAMDYLATATGGMSVGLALPARHGRTFESPPVSTWDLPLAWR